MNSRLPRLFVFLLVASLTISSTHARVGDSRSTLERRLVKDGGAIEITDGEVYATHIKKAPFMSAMPREGVEVVIYYKMAEEKRAYTSNLFDSRDRPANAPDGWLLYVVYYKDRSMLEMYRRSGGISTPEANGILLLNRGSANWIREELPEEEYPDAEYKPLMKHNLHRSDYELLANLDKDALTIYSLNFEAYLSKTKQEREEEEAPQSLTGF